MAGKTPPQAVEQFLEPIRRSLSCVTTAVVHVAGGYHPQDQPHVLLLGKGEAVKLKGDLGLSLTVIMHYRIVEAGGDSGPWKVRTAAYQYSVDNAQGREIFSYQWHPEGQSQVQVPHLHVGAGAGTLSAKVGDAHFPTGRVSIEQVLHLLIVDFKVKPLKSNWDKLLKSSQQAFERYRTWS